MMDFNKHDEIMSESVDEDNNRAGDMQPLLVQPQREEEIIENIPAPAGDYLAAGVEFPRIYCVPRDAALPLGIPEAQR